MEFIENSFLSLQRLRRVSCHTTQFSLQMVSQCWKNIHCKLQKTCCYTLQSRVATYNGFKPTSILCNCCEPQKVARKVANEIAPCDISCRARFNFLQRSQRFLKTITSSSWRLQRLTYLLHLAMNFFPTLRDNLQGKLHRVKADFHSLAPKPWLRISLY